jgi:hypothetical protein
MIKLGISLSTVTTSQLMTCIINFVNKCIQADRYIDVAIFYDTIINPSLLPACGLLSQKDMWGFDGIVIATDLNTAQKLIASPCPKARYFYVWDLEWTKMPQFIHKSLMDIYQNNQLPLIARSNYHYDILCNLWQKPSYKIANFDFDSIVNVCLQGENHDK